MKNIYRFFFVNIVLFAILFSVPVFALEVCSPGSGELKVMRLISILFLLIKVIIPLILIAFGTIDFAKTIISGDLSGLSNNTWLFCKRIIAGVVVFFVPTIINLFVNVLYNGDSIKNNTDLKRCTDCLFDINKCG